jgi:two-component system alkaline phosphatase synthesis response regulator PhoP
MTTILIVDDEPNLVELVHGYLIHEGYTVVTATDGARALQLAHSQHPDLVVLDVMLPGIDGIEVCRRLRQFSDAYVILLTARAEEIDKIVGLSVGADDYLTKPFSPRELVARIKAMLRRPRQQEGTGLMPQEPAPIRFGDLLIEEGRHEVRLRGNLVALTPREFTLLAVLARHPGRVFTRAQLLEQVWGDEYYDDHVVDVHVANVRKKLDENPSSPHFIETVRGVGYRFRLGAG